MNFQNKLDRITKKNNSLLCIGLDSDCEKINGSLFSFNKRIIDLTYDLVCAYKPNSAFYEELRWEGIKQLEATCKYIKNKHPQIPIILDAKRGDIGSTNKGYVKFAFDYLGVDAITVQPYLGSESLRPFLVRKDKGIIILCRTSNPGAGEIQDLKVSGKKLYKIIAKKVVQTWNKNNNCLLVVGATYPKELAEIREIAGDMTFLVPGIGAQGGDVEKTVKAGLDSKKAGMIISSSRGIIFAEDPREEAKKLKDLINSFRK